MLGVCSRLLFLLEDVCRSSTDISKNKVRKTKNSCVSVLPNILVAALPRCSSVISPQSRNTKYDKSGVSMSVRVFFFFASESVPVFAGKPTPLEVPSCVSHAGGRS